MASYRKSTRGVLMIEKIPVKEWSANDDLPRGFSEWLHDTVKELGVNQKREFRQIAADFGVNPSILSRWIVGKGPLTQADIKSLAAYLSPVVYTFLGIPRPLIDETLAEEFQDLD